MNKLVCVVGPTASGKTKYAISLHKQSPSILVSADSRQVYREMDIVTGKDHPNDTPIYGIDIVDSNEDCSVSVWYDAVMPRIETAWKEGKQVIVVGGTGLYVKAITNGIETISIPINQCLRDELSPLSITELQRKLKEVDEQKFLSMNNSDVNNSRRLVRAIEIEIFKKEYQNHEEATASQMDCKDINMFGLKCIDDSNYRYRIIQRVEERLKSGAIEETKKLLAKYDPNSKPMTAIGYKSIIKYIKMACTKEAMINEWVSNEVAYSKRQMTWFRKQPVIWYDVANQTGE